MGNYILKKDTVLLRLNNLNMEAFYENLYFIVKERTISDNNLLDFIEHLDQNEYGRGCVYVDLSDYFDLEKDKTSIQLLYELVGETIKLIKLKNHYHPSLISVLIEFHDKII